ncbi:MAG TPA: hypothetical protein VK679_07855 [Gemmatimonadaceae bacterium]|jgi:hypothetical protein|nr:hypothetical protein [Gemmatimonadaceae bacterium]
MSKRLALIPCIFPLAVACSDSSGPSAAVRFDQLYNQVCQLAIDSASIDSRPDPGSPFWPRCTALAILVSAAASGAEPSPIQVGTAAGDETWGAIVVAEVDTEPNGSVDDSSFSLVAYSDAKATTMVVAQYGASAFGFTGFGTALYTDAPLTISGTGGPGVFSTRSVGSPCRDVQGVTNPFGSDTSDYMPIEYAPSVCHLATFTVQVATTFAATPGLNPAFQSIDIAMQPVNGVRVINHNVATERLHARGYK